MQIELQGTRKKKATTWNGSWSNGLPTPYSDVVLASAYNTSVNGSFSCYNLNINANLTIAADTQIKVLGPLVVQGASAVFNVDNRGQFILLNTDVDTSTVKLTANFSPQSLVQRLDYWFLCSPLSGIPIKSISPLTSTYPMRFYEYGYGVSSNGEILDGYYIILDPTVSTAAAKGYIIRSPNNFSSTPGYWNITVNNLTAGSLNKGVIFHTPSFLTNSGLGGGGYYIVGNPYLANIDLRKFLEYNSDKIYDTIWIWYKTNNPDTESYAQLNSRDSRSTVFSTSIRPFQAFIVQYKNPGDTDSTLVFTPDMQIIGKNFEHNYFNLDYKQNSVNIPVGCCTYNADTFEQKFTDVDSVSLFSFIKEGVNKVLYRDVPPYEGQIIDLYYKAIATENYIISLKGYDGSFNNFKILLLDTELNTVTDLKAGAYTFAGTLGQSSSTRFKIKITSL
ncbi:hypothetical protein ACLI1A_11670 [Flavobacterium sp. RHBU_3]|uniref:hypothetical protein n=1 Tax=Flavobacterium sp. RHBU_3 TaxID=3391184 RepID=UPI0039851621